MIHHPEDALLMKLAGGQLASGPAAIVAAHVERCDACQARRFEFEAMAGVLLEHLEPHPLSPEALTQTLARIDAAASTPPEAATPSRGATGGLRASLPVGVTWPRSLHFSAATRWRRIAPGLRFSRVTLAHDRAANMYLLRVAPGKSLPVHSHRGGELTYVLHGAFEEDGVRFNAGDFEDGAARTHHQPVATADSECVCLTSIEGRVAFEGPLAKVMGSLLGL
jgi:putative transcriptional regulator